MAQEKEIEIVIDENGEMTIEAIGYKGKGCAEDIEALMKEIGAKDNKKSTKKKEYYLKEKSNITQKKK